MSMLAELGAVRRKAALLTVTAATALTMLTAPAVPATAAGEERDGRVDVHVHLQGGRDYDSAAERLLADMDRAGVERAILMSPPRTPQNPDPEEFRELARVARAHPGRLLLAGGGSMLNSMIHAHAPGEVTADVRAEFAARAERLAQGRIAAFGEMAATHLSFFPAHPFEQAPPDHPLFLLLADLSARHGIPIDLHTEAVTAETPTPAGLRGSNPATLAPTIPGLERLLAHNRRATIVWQHIGWDNTGQMTVGLLRRLLAEHPNLCLALRVEERLWAMDGSPMPNRIVDAAGWVRPEWLALFQEFPDRFVIGSDQFFSSQTVRRRMPQSFEETWAILDQLPPELARKIGGKNAARIYHLG